MRRSRPRRETTEMKVIKTADVIILIGGIAGAVIAIATVLSKLFGKVKKVADMVYDIKEHTQENYMNNLRLIIMSNEMPIGERLIAGEKYIKCGGNGEIKTVVKKLEMEYLNEK